MNKKGNEIAFGTIVTIVVVLLVLSITAYFIVKGTAQGNSGTTCEGKGTCIALNEECQGSIAPLSCPGDKPKCCVG